MELYFENTFDCLQWGDYTGGIDLFFGVRQGGVCIFIFIILRGGRRHGGGSTVAEAM